MTVAASPILVLLAVLVVVALLVGARSRAMAWTGLLLVAAIVVSLGIVGWFSVREQTALLEQTARVAKPGVPAPVPTDPSGVGQTAAGVPEVPATRVVPPQRAGPAIRPASASAPAAPPGQRPRKLGAFFRALAASVDGERNVNIAKRNAYGALLAMLEGGGALVAPPDWIESASRWLDDGTAYQTTAITRFVKLEGLFDEIDDTLCQATLHYVRENIGDEFGETLPLNGKELRRLIADRYYEYHTVEVGGDRQRLVRAHLLLTFDETAHGELQKLYDQAAAEQRRSEEEIAVQQREMTIACRLRAAGGILAGILGMLALVYGYLRIDDATDGKHRGRLRAAAVLAILAGIAAALFSTL